VIGLSALWASGALDPGSPGIYAGLTPTLGETFTDNGRGWTEGDFADQAATYAFGLDRGRYLVDFATNGDDQTYWSTIEYGPVDQPYVVEVLTATNTPDSRCGLALGSADGLIVISLGDSELVAQAVQGASTVDLGRWPVSSPPGVSTRLAVRVEGSEATAYIDDQPVGAFPAPSLGRITEIGVSAWGLTQASCGFEEIGIHE
jgi:hypothetical protein